MVPVACVSWDPSAGWQEGSQRSLGEKRARASSETPSDEVSIVASSVSWLGAEGHWLAVGGCPAPDPGGPAPGAPPLTPASSRAQNLQPRRWAPEGLAQPLSWLSLGALLAWTRSLHCGESRASPWARCRPCWCPGGLDAPQVAKEALGTARASGCRRSAFSPTQRAGSRWPPGRSQAHGARLARSLKPRTPAAWPSVNLPRPSRHRPQGVSH